MLSDFERLAELLQKLPGNGAAIAYSGGVDSTTLARAAEIAIGRDHLLLLLADSCFLPQSEKAFALGFAEARRWHCEVVPFDPLSDPEIAGNGLRRCYACKKNFFAAMQKIALACGFPVLCDGANLDDLNDFRPGQQAADELGVRHLFCEAKMNKAAIRDLAHDFALPNAQAPAAACLASRIPAGTSISMAALRRIDQAETAIRQLDFSGIRVRDYGTLGKLEVPHQQLKRAFEQKEAIRQAMQSAGYASAALDLAGYRQGAVNGVSQASEKDGVL